MRPHHRLTYPRALHPGAWWLWALGLAAAASRTTNPVPLLLLMAVTWFVVTARRGDTPWAASYGRMNSPRAASKRAPAVTGRSRKPTGSGYA